MKFLCPTCRTPLPLVPAAAVVPCSQCGVAVDLTRIDTSPGSSALSPEVDLTGESLGSYQLGAQIGSGGMGAVYEAQGPAGACAVKVLATTLGAEPSLRERFRREAKALAAVAHPGVVRVLEDGEQKGFCWYAMERVQGPDLRARIKEGRLPALEVLRLAEELLAALEAVHSRGLVHRDIKPGNILLSPQGAKLCDFGIARFDGSTTLTESAALMGSLRYMAPEQRRGLADARSDLYASGLVLYEALAGGLPDEVPAPAAPARLRGLIDALLRNKPEERPHTAAAARAWLAPAPWRSRPSAWVAAAAALLLAGGGWLGYLRVFATGPARSQALAAPVTQKEPAPNPVAPLPPPEPVLVPENPPQQAVVAKSKATPKPRQLTEEDDPKAKYFREYQEKQKALASRGTGGGKKARPPPKIEPAPEANVGVKSQVFGSKSTPVSFKDDSIQGELNAANRAPDSPAQAQVPPPDNAEQQQQQAVQQAPTKPASKKRFKKTADFPISAQ